MDRWWIILVLGNWINSKWIYLDDDIFGLGYFEIIEIKWDN
jgi:hypothetical protein